MERLVEQSEHFFWKIRGTGLTAYVGKSKGWLSNQNILAEQSVALDSQAMLEHAKVVLSNQNTSSDKSEALYSLSMFEHVKIIWAIRTSLLSNPQNWTHKLC